MRDLQSMSEYIDWVSAELLRKLDVCEVIGKEGQAALEHKRDVQIGTYLQYLNGGS